MLFKNKLRFRAGIISLILVFCLSFLSSPALASNEPWKTPPIPQGWSYVEGTWNSGYVIKDSHGNEFVWVPVGAVNKNAAGKAELKAYDWSQGIKAPGDVTYVNDSHVTKVNNAIAATGGFYVARYQASNNGGKAQSRKNVTPWNSIDWHNAKSKSESMATDYGWTGLYSHLLYDKEWDVIVKWLENSGVNVTDSSSYGNYSNSLKNTGSSESYKKNNIYDLAGNLWEWTVDAPSSSSASRLLRGGGWSNNGDYYPVSCRGNITSAVTYNDIGFRSAFVVLNSAPSVALKNPAQGANITKGTSVNLTWSASDADGDTITDYNLRIGTSVGNSSLGTYSGANTSYSFNTSNITGPYPKTIFWAVRAKDDKGAWSDWKEGTFKITASNVATLSNITISKGSLAPIFNSNTLNYSVSVPFTTNSINITPTITEPNATIKVNGNNANSVQSVPINLSVGNNEVKLVVTAQDGTTTKTYTITINRAANAIPVITLDTLKNKYSEVDGHNQVVVRGTVKDADNDDVTVYLQVKKGGTTIGSDNQVLQKCKDGKEFIFELTIDNTIAEGKYTIEIWADDGK